jgi:hypothetical protein
MFPDGFQWRYWIDGQALFLGDAMIATITPVREHVRVCTNSNDVRQRYRFFDAETTGIRYVEA